MSTADLRLVSLLILLVAVAAIFTNCTDAPVAPDNADVRFAPGGIPGPNPDAPGGGKKGDRGAQVEGNFSIGFDGADDGTRAADSNDLDLTDTWTIEGWLKPPAEVAAIHSWRSVPGFRLLLEQQAYSSDAYTEELEANSDDLITALELVAGTER